MGFLFAVAVAGVVVWIVGITMILAKLISGFDAMHWDLSAQERHLEDVDDRLTVLEDLLRTGHPAVRADIRRRLHAVASQEVQHAQGH